ncbi:unnamed protein product [Oppiella nova]|uniref:Uncharacterized protein n=1 Tax=Oppiella nova TaxID=334625 RepID=A0A7R9QVD2_9ACAR|nr:unnamed protein product [Oppiella nova]CAG2175358.1 unnamed protein product [Oppiella nova]
MMRNNMSLQLTDQPHNAVSGINRNSPSRTSIRISPPIAPNNETKTNVRTNSSNVMRSDSEPHSLLVNQMSGIHPNNVLMKNGNDVVNDMYSHPYYDSNNYMSHTNKYGISVGQTAMIGTNGVSNGAVVVANGMNCVNLNPNTINHSRASLEDHGVDVGRVSPSTSSNDSRKSRYSSASLDSGRGSDTKTTGQSHRVSVHSCESLGSQSSNKDNYNRNSSSSSSIGSGNSVTTDADITITGDHTWTSL